MHIMQVRDALERSLLDMEAFFSQFEPLDDDAFAKAIRGVDAVGAAPAFNIKIVLQGKMHVRMQVWGWGWGSVRPRECLSVCVGCTCACRCVCVRERERARARERKRLPVCASAEMMHVRMQPTVDDFESALSALIDHSVAVCEGIPAIEPHVLKPYSPFAPPELALEREEAVPEAEVAADAAALSKAMYAEAVTCLKVVGGPPSTCTSYVYMCMCLCCAYCDIHEHTCRYISLSVCVS